MLQRQNNINITRKTGKFYLQHLVERLTCCVWMQHLWVESEAGNLSLSGLLLKAHCRGTSKLHHERLPLLSRLLTTGYLPAHEAVNTIISLACRQHN